VSHGRLRRGGKRKRKKREKREFRGLSLADER